MQVLRELDSGTIERLGKQGKLLLRIYQAELAKNPSSQATESSRSNVIALRHTVHQIYGDAAVSRLPQHIFSLPHA
jgi:hypothetical protein